MKMFRWSGSGDVPAALDLRQRNWALVDAQPPLERCVTLLEAQGIDSLCLEQRVAGMALPARRQLIVCGIDCPAQRASLLRMGLGDVTSAAITLDELEERAHRVLEAADSLPRQRVSGSIELDFLTRKARIGGKPLALHPQEFTLLWCLAGSPSTSVQRESFMETMWWHGHSPYSNSFAVHLSRLRSKLALAGWPGMIERLDDGYRLNMSKSPGVKSPARPCQRTAELTATVAVRTPFNGGDSREL